MHLGTAFQLIDDVLDYSGDLHETGKNIGDDLAEGKPTLPLIYAMQHGTAEQAAMIRSAIEHGGLDDFQSVLAAIIDTGALEYARASSAARSRRRPMQRFAALPDSNSGISFATIGGLRGDRSY